MRKSCAYLGFSWCDGHVTHSLAPTHTRTSPSPPGYDLVHNGRLMTLFSASRYCGLQANKGAFLSMKSDLQPEIQQYYAHAMQVGR